MNRLIYEREPDLWELEDETYNWDDIEVENGISYYGLLEDIAYNELMKDYKEELEI